MPASTTTPVALACPMSTLPLFPLFVMTLLALAGLLAFAAARDARRREAVRAAHAATLDPATLPGLHDHFLRTAVRCYGEREIARGRERIECAVALRDRLDALAGRPSGALNRARQRARLLPGAYRLRGWPPPRQVEAYLDAHALSAAVGDTQALEADALRMLATVARPGA